jgi:mannose-1-phosphate guanylyltransferase/mannose-6-phosphate isomerase
MHIYPVILCGGSGTRLWPLSRGGYPKQYLKLTGQHTLLQQTALRLRALDGAMAPLVIANNEQRFLVAEQLREVDVKPSSIVLEPVGRNTAPAVAAAALLALRESPDALLLIVPSDHVIAEETAFAAKVKEAAQIAKDGYMATFGIEPTEAHTGYGYIRRGARLGSSGDTYRVDAFVEKPDTQRANVFLRDGGYYWNSGMFMMKASTYVEELSRHEPDTARLVDTALHCATRDSDFVRLDAAAFAGCRNVSIDYAVMEKTDRAVVVAAGELGWNDIGSWDSVAALSAADPAGNAILGDVFIDAVSNSYIRAEHRMVAAVGLQDVVIVETADAVLVASRDKAQDVKKIVEQLNAAGRHEPSTHRRVVRPWGAYEGIDQGDRFQVKRIIVNPSAQLSLQKHHHRAEHWIVVKGTALVTNGDQQIMLSENQSTYIPLGTVHRLTNPGKIPLELIEVQSGTYLGEDDIVRIEDTYGRASDDAGRHS